jgi:catalase
MEAATLLFLILRNLKQNCAYISAPGLLCSPILELTPHASTFSKREAKSARWTGSYAEERFNSVNSFIFVDSSATDHVVRWSLLPAAQPVALSPEELAKRGPDFLEQEIAQRVANAPQRWTMVVTVANPGDPTADPSEAWPANRRTIEVGTLIAQHVQAERDGPCRDINFDPTVLPSGMRTSDDPFPAARSAAYAKSYDLRTAGPRIIPGP